MGTKDPVTYYKDIKPIVDTKCAQCHAEGEGGQFSLQTYAAIKPLAAVVKESVSTGSMPPWKADGAAGKYLGDRRLTDAEASKIVGWVEQGSPEGRAQDEVKQTRPAPSKLARVDLTIGMEDAYTPAAGGDDYRCFVLEWTPTTTKFVTGVGIVPGDKQLVRHASVHVVDPADVATIAARDGLDGDLGYPCMSGPTNSPWIASYEPAGGSKPNPAGVGIEIKPGSALVLQVHYNTLHKGGPDQSKVELTLENTAARRGEIALLFNQTWAAKALRIPANEPDTVFRHEFRPTNLARNTTYDLYWADLHMHKFGKSGSVGIVRQGGATEPLLSISDWDYGWQQTYTLAAPARLGPNDSLYVECRFDNTDANQPIGAAPTERNWGETQNDEICIGNVLAAAATAGGTPVPPPDAGVPDAGNSNRPDASVPPPRTDGGRPPVVNPDPGPDPRPTPRPTPTPTPTPRPTPTPTPTPRPTPTPPPRPTPTPTPPRPDPCVNTGGGGPVVISGGRTVTIGTGQPSNGSVTRCVR